MSLFKAVFSTDAGLEASFSGGDDLEARFGQVFQSGIVSAEIDRIKILDLAEYESIPHDGKTLYFIRG